MPSTYYWRKKNEEEIKRIKDEINSEKDGLIWAEQHLRELGAVREANTLSTIIESLERWQNK